jgi:hypothetical protein
LQGGSINNYGYDGAVGGDVMVSSRQTRVSLIVRNAVFSLRYMELAKTSNFVFGYLMTFRGGIS